MSALPCPLPKSLVGPSRCPKSSPPSLAWPFAKSEPHRQCHPQAVGQLPLALLPALAGVPRGQEAARRSEICCSRQAAAEEESKGKERLGEKPEEGRGIDLRSEQGRATRRTKPLSSGFQLGQQGQRCTSDKKWPSPAWCSGCHDETNHMPSAKRTKVCLSSSDMHNQLSLSSFFCESQHLRPS